MTISTNKSNVEQKVRDDRPAWVKEWEWLDALALSAFEPLPREEIDIDLIKYEVLKHRLFEILESGRFALQRISGSPIVTECGESMFSLYDAEGNCVLTASGILLHLTGVQNAIKVTMEWYSENPGIGPGDQFFWNDPYVSGQHACDQAIVKPVFHEGKLVAWIASLTHTTEPGAIVPGGFPTTATDLFQEGYRLQGMRIVRDGTIDHSIMKSLERGTRNPRLVSLDTRGKIAGNNVAARLLLEVFAEYGEDFVKKLFRKMIYEAEDRGRARLRTIPDGTWRERVWLDSDGAVDKLYPICLTATKEDDKLILDFTGTSPQNQHAVNCTLPGTIGGIFVSLASILFWDNLWNRGLCHPVDIIIERGTTASATYPTPVCCCPPTTGNVVSTLCTIVFGKMLKAAGYDDDVNAAWRGAWTGWIGGGLDQYGLPWGGLHMDINAGGGGASPRRDGSDTGNFQMAPENNASDVENYESKYPGLYLFRREWVSSGGHGKFRGGLGAEYAIKTHKSPFVVLEHIGLGKYTAVTPGTFGGYPADSNDSALIYEPDLENTHFKHSRTVETFDEFFSYPQIATGGSSYRPARPLTAGDISICRWLGGAGYGDPLQRDPELVRRDAIDRKIHFEHARSMYGVVLDPGTATIREVETEALREDMRAERRRQWVWPNGHRPAQRHSHDTVGKIVPFHEVLEIYKNDEEAIIRCTECGTVICDATENYKLHVPYFHREPADIGHKNIKPDWNMYKEYYCPGCATLLDVAVINPSDPNEDLWSEELFV